MSCDGGARRCLKLRPEKQRSRTCQPWWREAGSDGAKFARKRSLVCCGSGLFHEFHLDGVDDHKSFRSFVGNRDGRFFFAAAF